ncbi:MAG TPA: FAD-linked oxidase C-terminal domain-containing protein [Bryobacteraceae bacterium]
MLSPAAKERIAALLGVRGYLDRPEDLALYEYDGGQDRHPPDVVVFPRTAVEVGALVRIANQSGMPIVGRGAGTGLSGGAIPRQGGMMIAFARMNRILNLDTANERAVVEPGVVNLDVTIAVERDGYFFAPDPSSQRACTVGGNVAENAGGPHTLAYGVTTNHVLGLELVLPDGSVIETGGLPDLPGYDLTGLLTGSEGTLALVTKATLRLMRKPEKVKTVLAIYSSSDDAGRTVAEITAQAITPVALEMLDGVMLRMVEEATHAGYPVDAAAVLLIELEGIREAVETQVEQVRAACQSSGSIEFRVARTPEERERLWSGRKNAFGAVGRVSPSYYVQDGVVPRTRIAATLRFIASVASQHGLTISNIFHAGDGNLHPIILFNPRTPGEKEKARHAGEEILRWCIGCGGSITGEHGVGMEKNELMPLLFPADTLETIGRIKLLFDPESRMNPGKLLPTGRGCSEIRQPALQPGSMVY